MDSDYDTKKQAISGVKTGCFSIIVGSIVALPLVAIYMDIITLQLTGNPRSPFAEYSVESSIFLCVFGVVFNIFPYVIAGIVVEIFELSPRGGCDNRIIGNGGINFHGKKFLFRYCNIKLL